MSGLFQPGARIAVIAPSGAYDPARLELGLSWLRELGLDPVLFPGLLQPERYLAAPDAVRLAHLNEALCAPGWDGVWAARGGYGATRLLDGVRWSDVQARPMLGFSDITAIHVSLLARTPALPVHAPVINSIVASDEASQAALRALIFGDLPSLSGEVWSPGTVSAPLIGGNLAMLAALCGTPYQPNTAGKLLLLEDVGEPIYRIDRLLQQLSSAGLFRDVAGVLVGTFTDCRAPEGATFTVNDVLQEALLSLGCPVLAGLPVGHGAQNHPVVLGQRYTLSDTTLTPDPGHWA